jgi:hypothetical protein
MMDSSKSFKKINTEAKDKIRLRAKKEKEENNKLTKQMQLS